MYKIDAFLENPLFLDGSIGRHFRQTPFGCIDVGSRGGVTSYIDPVAGISCVLAFEPDPEECARLAERSRGYANFKASSLALSASSRQSTLHHLKRSINNSLLSPNPNFAARYSVEGFAIERLESINAISLDEALAQLKSPFRYGEFIKLDVQGAELEILSGAGGLLGDTTVAALIEVEFCELYLGQPSFNDIDRFMQDAGFTFYGFHDLSFRSGAMRELLHRKGAAWKERLIAADAVFFKDPFEKKGQTTVLTERNIYSLFVSTLILGYFDLAKELLSLTGFDVAERQALGSFIENLATSQP